jgi:DtxR family Mn-dependent transcriptional regulator
LTAFLRDILGISAETAEKDACKMEHLLSEETLKKMRALTKSKAKAVLG